MKKFFSALLMFCVISALTGCSSVARGVTEAILEREKEDTRMCEIAGPPFNGVKDSINQASAGASHTKVLMVHGIGKHLPDYSAHFREKLVRKLDLESMDPAIKRIELVNDAKNGVPVGLLKIYHYYNSASQHDLLFYELTWSPISDEAKKVIEFDSSEAYSYRRADLNKSLKSFMNQTVPDLLVYEGEERALINKSVGQSICWMFRDQWADLPESGVHYCDFRDNKIGNNIRQDDYFVVTHSLGSRITLDTFNNYALLQKTCPECKYPQSFTSAMKDEALTVFMMANQLPLLQVGRSKPDFTGQVENFCNPAGSKYDERLVGKTRIVAFSDPNDILSYPIPPDYVENYIDSRTCPEIVNVELNVAHPTDLFGVMNLANPLEAHVGYQEDDRVIEIISSGLHRDNLSPLIAQKCNWTNIAVKEH